MGLRLLALACLAGAAFAGPYQREVQNECAKECRPSSNPNIAWKEGTADSYHFELENNVTYSESQTHKTSVEGTLEFHSISQCQAVLKLKNIRMNQKLTEDEKEDFRKKLEIPLSFARNGLVVEHICPSPEESTQSLNIKKAMISSFINPMSKLDQPEEIETYDSYGKCNAKYTPTKTKNGLVIRKEVDLHSCTNKHTFHILFLSTKIPSSLIFEKSSLECTQHIEYKVLKRVECFETERMKPPVKDKNSWFQLSSKLRIEHFEKKPAEHFISKEDTPKEELLYGIEETRKGDSNEKHLEETLKKICSKNTDVVDTSISSDYIKLGEQAKSCSYETLDRMYESMKYGNLCSSKKVKDLFIDTLPMIGTEAAVKLMVKMIENKEVSGLKAKLWPFSFALIRNPTKEMASAVVPLVKRDSSLPVMLGVTAMIHRLCTTEDCKRVDHVNQIVSVFNEYLGDKCSSDDDDKILAVLKAFGNMGYHGKAHKSIVACVQDSSKSIKLRLAGIEAFRRIKEKRPDEFVQMYKDPKENYEVRTAAFVSVSEHADLEQLQKIKETAESETDPQVGAYVSSYIKNMKKTSSQAKKNVKKLFSSLEIRLPKFKYWENSKHIEVSGFSKALNVGGGIETSVMHSDESKIPRSVSSRIYVDVFDKHVNLLELNLRTEGLERMLERIAGMKNSLPKEKSWDLFNSKHLWSDTDVEVSSFIRMLDIQMLDVSATDLSGIGEMLKIAEMMNTLAQGKNADFSHSFVFMKSKLVIPSVTGRSYSIDFTGSSTVGVTAKSKVDILSFPRNADVHIHFQPSVNVEFSTTVGVQSDKCRPDLKLVSRLHFESDLEANVHLKKGQVAKATLTAPSENIMLAKFSTDVLFIDENHNERRIHDKMQNKVNYCFTKFHNALGLSFCATVSAQEPMMIRSFPYLMPFGTTEIAVKKSDRDLKSYEMRLEFLKSASQIKYLALVDTPGTNISRKCAFEVKATQHKGQKEFSFKLTSPFKTAGLSGSFKRDDKLIQGKVDAHCDSKQIISANITSRISSSRSRVNHQTSAVASYRDYEPVEVDGYITWSKGRKPQLSYDLSFYQPAFKTVRIKGNFKQEGHLKSSLKSDFKLSAEASINSSIGYVKIRGLLDKHHKQTQGLSVNLGIDYQKTGETAHSAVLSGMSQMSYEKINSNVKFETTNYPDANWHLNWDMQREPDDGMTNDVDLKYGRNLENKYINLKQASRIPKPGRGENTASIEIPQLNINYGVSVKHHIEMDPVSKFQVDAGIRYNQDKYINGLISLNYQSKDDLKVSGKIELDHNGKHYFWEDEFIRRRDNVIQGKSRFQYEEGRTIQLEYNSTGMSDESKFQHEFESTLKIPSSPIPIKSKLSLKMDKESLALAGHIGSEYSFQAHSNQVKTHVHLKHPSLEGKLKVNNEVSKKNISLDMRIKGDKQQHIVGSLVIEKSENKKGFHLEIIPDIDHQKEMKILVYTVVETLNSGTAYKSSSKLQIPELIVLTLNESGDLSVFGDQTFTFECNGNGWNPILVQFKRETDNKVSKTLMILSIEDIEVVKMLLNARWKNNGNKHEISVNGSITSSHHSFDNIEVRLLQTVTKSGLSTNMQSHLYFKKSEKVYKAEWNSGLQANGVELKVAMQTPHKNYEKQALGISVQRAPDGISSSMNVEVSNSKVISIETKVKKNNNELRAYIHVTTPFEDIKNTDFEVVVVNGINTKSLKSHVDVNYKRLADFKGSIELSSSETEVEGSVKFSNMKHVIYQGCSIKFRSTESSISASGSIQFTKNKELSVDLDVRKVGDMILITTTISTPHLKAGKIFLSFENPSSKRRFKCYIEANGERKGDAELSVASFSEGIVLNGHMKTVRTPEISANIKWEKNGESQTISANIVKDKSPLIFVSFNRLSHSRGEKISMKTRSLEKKVLDLEVSKDELRNNSKKFSFKASGKFPEISATFLVSYIDPTSVRTEVQVCQEGHHTECYRISSYHQNIPKSNKHRYYQTLKLELDKSVSERTEVIGSLQMVGYQDKYDSGSQLTLQIKDRKLGFDGKLHIPQHKDDHHSLVISICLPKRTSSFRALHIQNSHRIKLELDVVPNIEDPNRKFGIDMMRDMNPDSKDTSGYIKMEHPTRPEPWLFTFKSEDVDETFVKLKMLLHYSTTYGKTLIFELVPNLVQEQDGKRSIDIKLYRQDESLVVDLKLIKQSSRQEDKYEYEWNYTSDGDKKSGGVTATFYDKKAGKPKSLTIKYYSPSNDYAVQGSIVNAPEDVSVSLVSRGKKLKEISIKTSDSCLTTEVRSSGPLMSSSVCFNKREGDTLQLVKADIYCEQRKCLDARLYLDPQKPEFVSMSLKWKTRDISRSLGKTTGYDGIFKGRSLRKIFQELVDKLVNAKRDFLSLIQDKLWRGIERIREEISRKVTLAYKWRSDVLDEHLQSPVRWAKSLYNFIIDLLPVAYFKEQVVKPLYDTFSCFFHDYLKLVIDHIPRFLKMVMDITKAQFEHCLMKFCVEGTFCHDFFINYQQQGMLAAQNLFHKRIPHMKNIMKFPFPIPTKDDIINGIHHLIELGKKQIEQTFGKFIGDTVIAKIGDFGKKIENRLREKIIAFVNKCFDYINNIFAGDEDYRIAKSLVSDAKKNVVNVWRNREEIARRSLEKVKANIKENAKKMVDEQIQVEKFDIKKGDVRLSFRQPLGAAEVQILNNELRTINRKIVEYLRN